MRQRSWKQVELFPTEQEPANTAWPTEIESEVIGSLAELLLARARDQENASIQPRGNDELKDHT